MPKGTSLSSLDLICLVVKTPKTVVFSVDLPAPLTGTQLHHAIQFEVENFIPFPLEAVYWGYRKIPGGNRRFIVFAVWKNAVDVLFGKLADCGLKCDCFIPQQLLETLHQTATAQTESAGVKPDTETPEDSSVQQSSLQLFVTMLAEDPACNLLYLDACPVPKDLQPVRHRTMKCVNMILLLLTVLLTCAVLWNQYRDYR